MVRRCENGWRLVDCYVHGLIDRGVGWRGLGEDGASVRSMF